MGEIWKPVTIYGIHHPDGGWKYYISNLGRIQVSGYENDAGVYHEPVILEPTCDKDGHLWVALTDGNGLCCSFGIHMLVAREFVDNPNGYRYVRHRDGNKGNSRADNLEWCAARKRYSDKVAAEKWWSGNSIAVRQYTKTGVLVAEFPSTVQASQRTGVNKSCIMRACRGTRKTAGGFVWRFVDDSFECPGKNRRRSIRQYTLDGKLIMEYRSANKAAQALGVSQANISACCGRYYGRKTVGGFLWRYSDDDEFARLSEG